MLLVQRLIEHKPHVTLKEAPIVEYGVPAIGCAPGRAQSNGGASPGGRLVGTYLLSTDYGFVVASGAVDVHGT